MTKTFGLAVLAYVVPTFPLGYLWHLILFKDHYEALQVYRADIFIPFGILSMIIQGIAWAYIYARLFKGDSLVMGALKFMALAAPLAWSFLVIVIAAKHQMASVSGFVWLETGFTLVQYLVVSPLIAWAFSSRRP